MHIVIEGMDGSGKTSVSKLLAERLGYKFIEKPLHFLTDNGFEERFTQYKRITSQVNSMDDSFFRMCFYALGSVFTKCNFGDADIVTDRHLVSNFAYNRNHLDAQLMQVVIDHIGRPDLTVVLKPSMEERRKRLVARNPADSDIAHVGQDATFYGDMADFLERFKMKHFVLDNTNLSPEETVKEIIMILDGWR